SRRDGRGGHCTAPPGLPAATRPASLGPAARDASRWPGARSAARPTASSPCLLHHAPGAPAPPDGSDRPTPRRPLRTGRASHSSGRHSLPRLAKQLELRVPAGFVVAETTQADVLIDV